MPRPVPMTRALIVRARENLEATVESLYGLKLVHIVDHREGEEGLEIGRPLPTASEASEILVKLRSIASVLQLEETPPAPTEEVAGDLREKILSLELNISEEDAARKKTQALLQDLNRKIDEVRPFAQLPLSLVDYRGYDTLEVFVGKVAGEIEDLDSVTPDYEAFSAPGLLAVFVPKPKAAAMRDFLTQHGFTSIPAPEGDGDPREVLSNLLTERERWEARLQDVEERLETLRERYAGFLSAAKAHLEVTVEKAEAPLRFAVTDHTSIVEGWVPTESFEKLAGELGRFPGLFVTELEQNHGAEPVEPAPAEADPPVLLRNPKPLRPFEMLVKLFSTPNYREIDPTFVLTFTFPIFFGLMVGDAGYGLVWMVYGIWLLRRWKDRAWDFWKNLLVTLIWGGFWSLLFGVFFFGEAFGIPFHHAELATTRVELLGWFPREGYVYAQIGFGPNNPIPWAAIGMLLSGVGLLLATEGPLHIMEFFGLLANIVSYARLAAVGVAKAAMAFAFNVIVLETMIFPALDSGNVVSLILLILVGFFFGFLFHFIVFLLGALTAIIQAIRLNYVEFFIKFFRGAGTPFQPFGERAKPEV